MDFPFVKEAISQLFSKPSTVPYPFVPAPAKPNYRGRIVFHPDKCINCNMCERVCAGQAISHTSEPCEEGERVTRRFYLGSCTFCSHCASFCTHGAIEFSDDYHMVADYFHAATFEEGEEALIVTGTNIKKAPVRKAPPAKPAAPKETVKEAAAEVKEAVKLAKDEVKETAKEAVKEAAKEAAAEVKEAVKENTEEVKAAAAAAAAPVVEAVKETVEAVKEAVVPQPRDDGKPVQDPAKCVYCTLCARNCPAGALTVDRKAKTWVLDEDLCVACGTCQSVCPKDAIIM